MRKVIRHGTLSVAVVSADIILQYRGKQRYQGSSIGGNSGSGSSRRRLRVVVGEKRSERFSPLPLVDR